jgi:tRNA A-37 threonylcarbamoyl transferase component Bud32
MPLTLYRKPNVSYKEYKMQEYVYNLNIVNVPRVILYDKLKYELTMEKIKGSNLSDFYGEDSFNISSELFHKVRKIVKKLYDNNIIYPDITGYNFIQDNDGHIWIIDFEHSKFRFYKNENDNELEYKEDFVDKFINGLNKWNPEFR